MNAKISNMLVLSADTHWTPSVQTQILHMTIQADIIDSVHTYQIPEPEVKARNIFLVLMEALLG
jgi:hypothetical protein